MDDIIKIQLKQARKNVGDVIVPQIEEIRLIRGFDGEDYVNINDLYTMMKIIAYRLFPSLSVLLFIKAVIYEFIPPRR